MRFENYIKTKAFSQNGKAFLLYFHVAICLIEFCLFKHVYGKICRCKSKCGVFLKSTILGMDICFNIKYNISIKNYQIILDCHKRQKTI